VVDDVGFRSRAGAFAVVGARRGAAATGGFCGDAVAICESVPAGATKIETKKQSYENTFHNKDSDRKKLIKDVSRLSMFPTSK